MSLYGDQWVCACGWSNVFVRTNCRNCGAAKPADAIVAPLLHAPAVVGGDTATGWPAVLLNALDDLARVFTARPDIYRQCEPLMGFAEHAALHKARELLIAAGRVA